MSRPSLVLCFRAQVSTVLCGSSWGWICFQVHSGYWVNSVPCVCRLRPLFLCWLSPGGWFSASKGCSHSLVHGSPYIFEHDNSRLSPFFMIWISLMSVFCSISDLTFLPSIASKDSFDYIGPTGIIQGNSLCKISWLLTLILSAETLHSSACINV